MPRQARVGENLGGVQSHFHVKPNLHCIALGCWLSCVFDNRSYLAYILLTPIT